MQQNSTNKKAFLLTHFHFQIVFFIWIWVVLVQLLLILASIRSGLLPLWTHSLCKCKCLLLANDYTNGIYHLLPIDPFKMRKATRIFHFTVLLLVPQQKNLCRDYGPCPGTCFMSPTSRSSEPHPAADLIAAEKHVAPLASNSLVMMTAMMSLRVLYSRHPHPSYQVFSCIKVA